VNGVCSGKQNVEIIGLKLQLNQAGFSSITLHFAKVRMGWENERDPIAKKDNLDINLFHLRIMIPIIQIDPIPDFLILGFFPIDFGYSISAFLILGCPGDIPT
jgi:hypothetical protein